MSSLCDCRYARFSDHEPHNSLFCSAPIQLSAEDAAKLRELMSQPPKPLKITIPVEVERE